MSSENTKLWDMLGKTDPKHTKGFTRGGGFKGTAIKPMWSYRRMTEQFGPCGEGWGVNEPSFQVVPGTDGEVLVFCTVSVWYTFAAGERQRTVHGVGGDKVVTKFSSGLKSDDEAFKKAFTDAVTNALKLIGVGADVHMGLFDDSKYVAEMREEFADEPAPKHNGKSSAALKRDDAWAEFKADLADVNSTAALAKCKDVWREKVRRDGWPSAWVQAMPDEFAAVEKSLLMMAG